MYFWGQILIISDIENKNVKFIITRKKFSFKKCFVTKREGVRPYNKQTTRSPYMKLSSVRS
jgi:hypothetical protein